VVDSRTAVRREVLLVLGVSLGQSALYSLVSLIGKLTEQKALAEQTTALNVSQAPGRPWLDLTYQLLGVLFTVVPALLALHLLSVRGPVRSPLGLEWPGRRVWTDLGVGAALAAVIGIPGLGLYLAAVQLGVNTQIAAANLPDVWWAVPVLILSAAANGLLEEVVVVGYLLTRLSDLGWRTWHVIATSALVRGSYHLYQGFGGFVGNAIMGVVFALVFLRTRRLAPLVIAHTLLDVVAYLGYDLLHGRVSWL
jgi:membrane protease YdiL (CAAX protease family)